MVEIIARQWQSGLRIYVKEVGEIDLSSMTLWGSQNFVKLANWLYSPGDITLSEKVFKKVEICKEDLEKIISLARQISGNDHSKEIREMHDYLRSRLDWYNIKLP